MHWDWIAMGFISGLTASMLARLQCTRRIRRLEAALRIIRDDYDHDNDAHRYNTSGCRVCLASKALNEGKRDE